MAENNIEKLYQDLAAIVQESIYFDETERVIAMEEKLNSLLGDGVFLKKFPDYYHHFDELLTMLRWSKLNLATYQEAVSLFKTSLDVLIKIKDFDLRGKFRICLLGLPEFEDRDKLKEEIRNILIGSQVLMTAAKLQDGKQPTLENWLKIYSSYVGSDSADALKLQQLYLSDANFKNLPDDEKESLKKIFAFYERLKYSSYTPEGIEDQVPVNTPEFKGYIKDGELVKVDDRLKPELARTYDIATEAVSQENIVAPASVSSAAMQTPDNSQIAVSKIAEPINPNQAKIDELKKTAESFPVGSLERRAIEQEIASLNK